MWLIRSCAEVIVFVELQIVNLHDVRDIAVTHFEIIQLRDSELCLKGIHISCDFPLSVFPNLISLSFFLVRPLLRLKRMNDIIVS